MEERAGRLDFWTVGTLEHLNVECPSALTRATDICERGGQIGTGVCGHTGKYMDTVLIPWSGI